MPSSSRNPYSRFVPSEEVGEVTQWQFGDVDGPNPFHALPTSEEEAPNLINEEQQQALVQKTWDEAFALGVAQGHNEATVQWQQRMDEYIAVQGQQAAQQLTCIVQHLNARLDGMQQHMSEQILHLACDIARHVVRQELTQQPEKLQPVIQEALGLLVQDGRPATVRLHPDDMKMISLSFSPDGLVAQWLADSTVERGGCLVECAGSVIDATVPKRWERAIAALGLHQPWQQETLQSALSPEEVARANEFTSTITSSMPEPVAPSQPPEAVETVGASNDAAPLASGEPVVSTPTDGLDVDEVPMGRNASEVPDNAVEPSGSINPIGALFSDKEDPQ